MKGYVVTGLVAIVAIALVFRIPQVRAAVVGA
jgi:hypothetical protein